MPEVARASDPLDLTVSEAELEAQRTHIVSFIADQVDSAGTDLGIVAISGGIDSTLVSHLAVEALGAEGVYGMVLPSEVNRKANMSDAETVASDFLGIEYDIVDIEPLVEAFLRADPHLEPNVSTSEESELAVGNLRARIRAVLSYFEANRRGGIVLGTGNRTEAAIGYFTKYGDGAVDCHPIAPLYKQQVRQLARHVGVPDDFVDKTPTAGLWADQTDETELGVEYDTLDSILALHVDGPLSTTATARAIGIDAAVVERVRTLYRRSAHKRSSPPGPDRIH